jgi:hypothetical protein
MKHPIYIGTILPEPNRWPDRPGATYSRLRRLTGIDWGRPQSDVETLYRSAVADMRMLRKELGS